ncbi:DUF3142 domain-containing protein [Corallococcus exercitus]|uniref:DUF3142 domain-containing protein n=1 Tax=Corallococcus exercitus TaxID=2316736 RepID=A0A7Y4NSE9_9BACT|nr:DUF3142 domain-containing protein [Corallococcus exercitus]NOK35765.1 DUF3142 domain-containing protein [Corallococcus exercitus]
MLPERSLPHAAPGPRRGLLATLVLTLLCLPLSASMPVIPGPPPRLVLWAWERPEDLRFLEGRAVDVAFLLATLDLTDEDVHVVHRRQPLRVPPGVALKATVRLQMVPGSSLARFDSERLADLAGRLDVLARRHAVTALQLDFDARGSETDAYVDLLQRLRTRLPPGLSLSITGLASWCVPGGWIARAPVDEVVPQLFRMGPDAPVWRARFARGLPRPCSGSMGLAVDEWGPVPPGVSTLYLFNPRPWTPEAFARAVAETRS